MVVEVLQIQMLTHHVFQGSFKIKRSKVIPLAGRPMLICFLSTGHYNFGWWQRAGFSCRVLPPGGRPKLRRTSCVGLKTLRKTTKRLKVNSGVAISDFFLFSPRIPGEMIQFGEHILFQMGWSNHQQTNSKLAPEELMLERPYRSDVRGRVGLKTHWPRFLSQPEPTFFQMILVLVIGGLGIAKPPRKQYIPGI